MDWSQQVEHMQVPKGRDQVSGGVSVPCRHATPVATPLSLGSGEDLGNFCQRPKATVSQILSTSTGQ